MAARGGRGREPRRLGWTRWAGLAAVPVVFLAVPSLAHFPARLVAGCATWIALAALLELASILGFIGSFLGVFGTGMTRGQSVLTALRALGASTVLPGGGLVGPAVAVHSADRQPTSLGRLVRSTLAFVILTTAPSIAALALVGAALWLGWPAGPHGAFLTLSPVGVAVALLALTWLLGRRGGTASEAQRRLPRSVRWVTSNAKAVREGAADAGQLLGGRNWKLLGAALAYYAFDNAVLWASFRAYGSAPPIGVIMMGYLVGSLAAAVPIPGGLGAVEGGLIGALVLYGAPAGPAAAAVLLYRGISLGLAVTLGATAWACNRPPRRHSPRRQMQRLAAMSNSIIPRHSRPSPTAAPLEVHAGPPHPGRVRG